VLNCDTLSCENTQATYRTAVVFAKVLQKHHYIVMHFYDFRLELELEELLVIIPPKPSDFLIGFDLNGSFGPSMSVQR